MRVAIFANGVIEAPGSIKAAIRPDDLVIAADGGARNCLATGLFPDIVTGDMDSLAANVRAQLESGETQFISYPQDKDQTDLELALAHAVRAGAGEILLFGLLGGRLDQTLANLLLLSRPEWKQSRLIVSDGSETAYVLHGAGILSLPGRAGEVVSLIPLSPQVSGVTTQNLRWPLHEATLAFGSTWSISNQISSSPAEVRVEEGVLLVVHRAELP